jgi:hypothetical protein
MTYTDPDFGNYSKRVAQRNPKVTFPKATEGTRALMNQKEWEEFCAERRRLNL